MIARNTGVAPAPAQCDGPLSGPEPPLEAVDVAGRCLTRLVTRTADRDGDRLLGGRGHSGHVYQSNDWQPKMGMETQFYDAAWRVPKRS